jgi:hypothetical protein
MQVISDKNEIVFRTDYNGKPSYSLGLSKKNKEGQYVNGYIRAYFKKGVELNNKSKIRIKDAWIDFYRDGNKTIPTIFVSEYELEKDSGNENENIEEEVNSNPFEEFGNSKTDFDIGNQIKIEDDDLPF